MSTRRGWMIGLGGLLLLIGLLGFYAMEVRRIDEVDGFEGRLGRYARYRVDPMMRWPEPLPSLMQLWPWMLGTGMLLVLLGNGSHAVGHWYHLFDKLSAQPTELYRSVQEGLRERELPGFSAWSVGLRQGGLVSGKRKHLRVTRGYFRFDLYAAPFGKGFGIAWRCYRRMPFWQCALSAIPVLGWLSYYLFFRYTSYVEDRGLFFQTAVHRSVQDSLKGMTAEHGLRALSDAQLEPIRADMLRSWG